MALFKKDKDKKQKGENLIGKIIYACLLFAPMFAVAVACMYVIFNKNAYQSYSQNLTQNYSLNQTNIILKDQQYQFETNNDLLIGRTTEIIYVKNINQVYGALTLPENVTQFRVYYNPNNQSYSLQFTGDTITYTQISTQGTSITSSKTFSFIATQDQTTTDYNTNLYHFTYENNNTLDNVFYYQLNKLEESDLFNWAKETGTYTIIHTTTTQLGITNTYTPMLMAYWLLISVIYFLFDIALILIWAVHDKIHDLKDSI